MEWINTIHSACICSCMAGVVHVATGGDCVVRVDDDALDDSGWNCC